MSVPHFDELIQPTLDALHLLGGVQSIQSINKQIADALTLTADDLSQPHGDTKQTELEYRLAWARTYLKHYGLIVNPKRGMWSLTEEGQATREVDPKTITTFVQDLIKQGTADLEKPDDKTAPEMPAVDEFDPNGGQRRTLANPFNNMFASWDEADMVFDAIAEAARRLGITGPEDERIAVNLRYHDGSHQLHLSYGWWLVLGFAGNGGTLQETQLALFENQAPPGAFRTAQFTVRSGEQPVSLHWYAASQVKPFEGEAGAAFEATLQYAKARFEHWIGSPYRKYTKDAVIRAVFDPTARTKLLSQGLPPQGNDADDSEDQSVDEIEAIREAPIEPYAAASGSNATFTSRSFELLAGIHATPTKAYYHEHREAFKQFVEEPFQRVLRQVVERLPTQIRAVMETEAHLFSRFLKNDWGQGGAWDFYWGALYPKGGKRTEDAQLSIWIDYSRLEYGFYIGAYDSGQRRRFQRNCQSFGSALLPYLRAALPEDVVVFGNHQDFEVEADGTIRAKRRLTWQEFLDDAAAVENDVSVLVPRQQLLQLPEEELVDRIASTYVRLFPLVLLAIHDEPLPAIARFQVAVGLIEEDEERIPPKPYTGNDFLARTYLHPAQAEDLYELMLDKKQIILYGPPGTGKTFVAQELAKWIIGLADPPASRMEMIQFHPAYSYEDFIEGIRPESKATIDGRFIVDYPSRSGVFHRFCKLALENPDQPHIFVIDELNRGNIPRIFGELMLLLEYRERDVPLPYSGERFRIPRNVYLIGTMNTADRSIALVDFALRRRFHFFQFTADPDLLDRWLVDHPVPVPYLSTLYRRLSQEAIDDPAYAIGVSYFMDPDLTEAKLKRIWRRSILPYLVEYHIEQQARVKRWDWDSDLMRSIRGEM